MNSDYGNNRGLDEMVMVEEERKRAEEARRKKAEAEKKRKSREEAGRKKAEAEKARKEREERRKARDERREQSEKHRNIAESTGFDTENSFSPKPNNGGIIKPKFSLITQIQDAQKMQKKLIDDLRKKQWDDLSTGTDEIQIINTQNVENAKQGLADLEREETAAYGLGDNGYWNKNRKLDEEVNSIGQQSMTPSQKVVQPASKPSTNYAPPKNNWEADDWAIRGKQPTPMTVEPETKKTIAERNVTLWQQNHPQKPTDEMFDAQIGYYNNMVTKAQDDYVNSYGQSSKADASEKDWADYSEKVDDYVTQRDAFNRAKMGVDTTVVDDPERQDPEEDASGFVHEPEEESNLLEDIMENFSDAGEWVVNKVTGGVQWVQDNSEEIGELLTQAHEAEQAAEQKLLATPLVDLSADEFEDYQDIKLDSFEDELVIREEAEYNKLLKEQIQIYTDRFNDITEFEFFKDAEGFTSVDEYVEACFEEDNWEEKTREELDEKYDEKLVNEGELYNVAYETALELAGRSADGLNFEIENLTGQEIDQDIINNVMLVGYNDAGAQGELFKRYYDDGNMSIQITGYNEVHYTKEEAQALYILEREETKELVSLMLSAADMSSIGDVFMTAAGMLIDDDSTENALETVLKLIEKTPFEDVPVSALKKVVTDMGIDAVDNLVHDIYWDIDDIKGGNYIEVEATHTPIDDQTGEYQFALQTGILSANQTIRFYEVNGVYVCDPKNQLNRTVYGYELRLGEFLFEQEPSS